MDKTDLKENELQTIKWIEEQLDIDRHRLQQRFPFIGNFLMRLETDVGFWDDVPTACTNGKSIYVNALFYVGLNEEERLFVLAHEVFHCVMLHFLRVQNRDKMIWNIATDLEIHFLLTKENMTAPFVLPHDKNWNGCSAEQIYEFLLNQTKQYEAEMVSIEGGHGAEKESDSSSEKNKRGKSKETGKGSFDKDPNKRNLKESDGIKSAGKFKGLDQGFDTGIHDGGNPNDSEKNDPDEVRNEILDKLKSAIETTERTRGTVPAGIKGLVEKYSKREVNWKEMLSQFVTSCYNGNRKWLPPNKRYVYRGMYLPSLHDESLRAVVAVDTSGSCVQDLPKFFSELTGLLNTFGKYEVTIIQCDADVQKVEIFNENCNIPNDKKWEVAGWGGTSFCPVFQYLEKHREIDPACLIYLTDGYGDAPEKAPPFPVLWMLTTDGYEKFCDWGTKVKFKPEKN